MDPTDADVTIAIDLALQAIREGVAITESDHPIIVLARELCQALAETKANFYHRALARGASQSGRPAAITRKKRD